MSSDEGDYNVGYKKPPKHTRFQKGRSGNPAGRPKQKTDFLEIVRGALQRDVTITEGERRQTISAAEAIELRQMDAAMRGNQSDFRAVIDKMIKLKILADDVSPRGGFLVVEEPPSLEEWERGMAALREKNASGDHMKEIDDFLKERRNETQRK